MSTPIPENRAELSAWACAAATGGAIARVSGDGLRAIGITTDSRAVRENSCFVAIRGESHDGHAFVAKAEESGASLIVVERGRAVDVKTADVVEVEDTLVAWGQIARAHLRAWRRSRSSADGRVVAITGSAGKTTTKEMTRALLATLAPTFATRGNLNNRVGLPAVALCATPDHAFGVLEMGMNMRGEIAALAEIAEADVALVTNVGVAHAGGVGGTRSDIAREKGSIYEALAEGGVAIVNAEDTAALGQLSRSRAKRSLSFGRAWMSVSDYSLVHREPLGDGAQRVDFCRPGGEETSLELPLIGEAQVLDFLAALAAAEAVARRRIVDGEIARALTTLSLDGRLALIRLADGTLVIDDSYNANPESMRAGLAALAEIAKKRRKVAVIGEMKELGEVSQKEHEALGDAIVSAQCDLVIGCGGLADLALARAFASGVRVVGASSTDEAAEIASREIVAGDCVLVKGSRSVGTERVVQALSQSRGRKSTRPGSIRSPG